MGSEINTRDVSLKIIIDVLENGVFLHVELKKALDLYSYLKRNDRAFIKRLCAGTIEKKILLDAVLDRFSSVPVSRQKPVIRNILRMSLYQIMFMDSVPDSAACNEAVKLAKKHKFAALGGFVNGVLRNASRNYLSVLDEFDDNIILCVPQNIYMLMKEQYPDCCDDIFRTFCMHADKGVSIRLNRSLLKEDEEAYTQSICAKPLCIDMGAYQLHQTEGMESVNGFLNGWFNVQDISAALPVYLTLPEAGDCCLDVCAAPGGKTIQLLDALLGSGFVVSRDVSGARLSLIESDISRCGFKNVSVEQADASLFNKTDEEMYDRVYADVPCSGLGIIGSKPDIKYHFDPHGLETLIELQRKIIFNSAKYVKPGGILVYSTCTLNRNENECNVRWFLDKSSFELVDFSGKLPDIFSNFYKEKGMLTVLPQIGINEGFFLAVLKRVK